MFAPYAPETEAWARKAQRVVSGLDVSTRRHGNTWFVGVDALPNASDGSIDGVVMPFHGLAPDWHRAQVSIVYAGYPQQDDGESDAAHAFRRNRCAAHMDGLLPEGPQKRRHLREPHGFILGIPLSNVAASPLVVWEGSHRVMQAAFRRAFEGVAPKDYGDIDVTDIYQAARKSVFETCPQTTVIPKLGEAVLLHRHLIHGVAPWDGPAVEQGRQVVYFRPMIDPARWV